MGEYLQAACKRVVADFADLAAGFADGESDGFEVVAAGVTAGDEGIQAFEAVDHAAFDELFERAVDLQGRAKAVAVQSVENGVGGERAIGFRQRFENQ